MPRKTNKLTHKQKLFSKKFVEKKGASMEAALESYNCKNKNSAAVLGNWALKQPQVQREIERIMEEQNLTDELLMEKLREGLDANVVSDYKGEAKETDVPDLKTRHKYFESAIDIKGLKAPKQIESKSLNLDLQVETMSVEELVKAVSSQLLLLKQADEKGGEK